MLNLSISPSSSSSSCTNNVPFTSTSTPSPTGIWPVSPPSSGGRSHLPSPPNSSRTRQHNYDSNNEWKTSGTIPSLMGK